jgi:hypothetical protein
MRQRAEGRHTFGPKVTPPPTSRGDRRDPRRAWPDPFWLNGFRPPPRTSARVSVLAVPLLVVWRREDAKGVS